MKLRQVKTPGNAAFIGNKFFKIKNGRPFDENFWNFIRAGLSKGSHIFMYMAYEAVGYARNLPPYPLAMAWEAEEITKSLFLSYLRPAKYTERQQLVIYNLRPGLTFYSYAKGFKKIKEKLRQGYTYQVNYTFPMTFSFQGEWQKLALLALDSQNTDYSGFVAFGNTAFVSCSPELFFEIKGRRIITKPMKGTWPKHRIPDIDEKIQAENIMIVDLLRNDLGRICGIGSIKADLFERVELPTLWQLVSSISGELNGKTAWEQIFESLFPCGSITGAPKLSTQKVISEIEPGYRGIYTGTMGYISPDNEALFNVSIRTLDIDTKRKTGRLGVGGGVVWDSKPKKEYEEALSKARFFTDKFMDFYLIETMRIEGDRIPLINLHIKRILGSARLFGFKASRVELLKAIDLSLAQNSTRKSKIQKLRLTLDFRGNINIEISDFNDAKQEYTVCIYPKPLPKEDILLYHKTSRRGVFDEALKYAKAKGCDEAILLNEQGFITQGTFTNVFIERQGELFTPPVRHGLLPGVFRQYLIKEKKAFEMEISTDTLLSAGRVFVGNALRGLKRARITVFGKSTKKDRGKNESSNCI